MGWKWGNSDHFPIFFEIKKGPINPPSPLKFDKSWLQDESFKNLFLELWRPYDETLDRSAAFQFAENIKWLKGEVKDWAIAKILREDIELKTVEAELLQIYEGEGGGLLSLASKEARKHLIAQVLFSQGIVLLESAFFLLVK